MSNINSSQISPVIPSSIVRISEAPRGIFGGMIRGIRMVFAYPFTSLMYFAALPGLASAMNFTRESQNNTGGQNTTQTSQALLATNFSPEAPQTETGFDDINWLTDADFDLSDDEEIATRSNNNKTHLALPFNLDSILNAAGYPDPSDPNVMVGWTFPSQECEQQVLSDIFGNDTFHVENATQWRQDLNGTVFSQMILDREQLETAVGLGSLNQDECIGNFFVDQEATANAQARLDANNQVDQNLSQSNDETIRCRTIPNLGVRARDHMGAVTLDTELNECERTSDVAKHHRERRSLNGQSQQPNDLTTEQYQNISTNNTANLTQFESLDLAQRRAYASNIRQLLCPENLNLFFGEDVASQQRLMSLQDELRALCPSSNVSTLSSMNASLPSHRLGIFQLEQLLGNHLSNNLTGDIIVIAHRPLEDVTQDTRSLSTLLQVLKEAGVYVFSSLQEAWVNQISNIYQGGTTADAVVNEAVRKRPRRSTTQTTPEPTTEVYATTTNAVKETTSSEPTTGANTTTTANETTSSGANTEQSQSTTSSPPSDDPNWFGIMLAAGLLILIPAYLVKRKIKKSNHEGQNQQNQQNQEAEKQKTNKTKARRNRRRLLKEKQRIDMELQVLTPSLPKQNTQIRAEKTSLLTPEEDNTTTSYDADSISSECSLLTMRHSELLNMVVPIPQSYPNLFEAEKLDEAGVLPNNNSSPSFEPRPITESNAMSFEYLEALAQAAENNFHAIKVTITKAKTTENTENQRFNVTKGISKALNAFFLSERSITLRLNKVRSLLGQADSKNLDKVLLSQEQENLLQCLKLIQEAKKNAFSLITKYLRLLDNQMIAPLLSLNVSEAEAFPQDSQSPSFETSTQASSLLFNVSEAKVDVAKSPASILLEMEELLMDLESLDFQLLSMDRASLNLEIANDIMEQARGKMQRVMQLSKLQSVSRDIEVSRFLKRAKVHINMLESHYRMLIQPTSSSSIKDRAASLSFNINR